MRWILHIYKISKIDRIKSLLNAFRTFLIPVIWTIEYDTGKASYKPYDCIDCWLSTIQYDVECAFRGYWQGYQLEDIEGEPTIYSPEILKMIKEE